MALPALSVSPPCPAGHQGSSSGCISHLAVAEQTGADRAASYSPAKGTAQTHSPSLQDSAGLCGKGTSQRVCALAPTPAHTCVPGPMGAPAPPHAVPAVAAALTVSAPGPMDPALIALVLK